MEKIDSPFVQLTIRTDFWNGLCTNDEVPLYMEVIPYPCSIYPWNNLQCRRNHYLEQLMAMRFWGSARILSPVKGKLFQVMHKTTVV